MYTPLFIKPAAKALGISEPTLWRRIRRGEVLSFKGTKARVILIPKLACPPETQPPRLFVAGGLVERGMLTTVSEPGSGLLTSLAVSIASGASWLGQNILNPTKVLFVRSCGAVDHVLKTHENIRVVSACNLNLQETTIEGECKQFGAEVVFLNSTLLDQNNLFETVRALQKKFAVVVPGSIWNPFVPKPDVQISLNEDLTVEFYIRHHRSLKSALVKVSQL